MIILISKNVKNVDRYEFFCDALLRLFIFPERNFMPSVQATFWKTEAILSPIQCVHVSTCLWTDPYLIITLGSCVTPQVIMALVPLMTLWSCGGVVIRVRAVETNQRREGIEENQRNVLPQMSRVKRKRKIPKNFKMNFRKLISVKLTSSKWRN